MKKRIKSRLGQVLHVVAGVTLMAGLAGAAVMITASSGAFEQSEPPTNEELAATLVRVGLDPETMAAAGVLGADVDDVVADAVDYLGPNFAALKTADEQCAYLAKNVDSLGRTIRAGKDNGEDLTVYANLVSQLATAEAQREAYLAATFNAATVSLNGGVVDSIETIIANRNRKLPVQYLTADRTDAQWVALRDALANLRICDQLDETPHAGCSTLVTTTNAEGAVSTAKSNLDTNLAAVTTAFGSSIFE